MHFRLWFMLWSHLNWILLTLCTVDSQSVKLLNCRGCKMQLLDWCSEIPRCEHITPGLKSLHWLPAEKSIVFKLCLLVYKTRHCLAPLYLCGLLLPYAPARQLGSREQLGSRNLMVVPRARTQTNGNRLFSVAASVQWNQFQIASGVKRAWRLSRFHLKLTCLRSAMASSQKMLL